MARAPIDPAPRSYARGVTLLRRGTTSPEELARLAGTPAELRAWLLGPAASEDDTLALILGFCGRLAGAGLGIDRISLHAGTLHPQAVGFAWNWSRLDGICDEVRVSPLTLSTDSYRLTPLFRTVEHGERFRGDPRNAELVARYPFLRELGASGMTDYLVFPVEGGFGRRNAASLATAAPDGFSEAALAEIEAAFALFALHLGRHIALRIADNIAQTYLGEGAGQRVLRGSIRRGTGSAGEAVIWVSDLRGYTDLSERLQPEGTLAVLNGYFDVMAGAVLANGGEVLKFVGDGLLGAFSVAELGGRHAAAAAALAASHAALDGLVRLNAEPPAELAAISGWQPLRTGIALHAGTVFFGNVGSPDRLDFTVIGRAVNVASRIEGLCKPLGRTLLISQVVADYVTEPLEDLGAHALRGVAEPLRVWGLPAAA